MAYYCDPTKNTECKKTYCGFYDRGECFLTLHEEYARLDFNGKPIGVTAHDYGELKASEV